MSARVIQPQRLRLARSLQGLSQKDLAAKVDVSPPTLSQYEAGASIPSAETLRRLSVVLGVSQDFFARPWRPSEVSGPFFRSLRSTPQRARDQARAYAQLIAELADELDRYFEFPGVDFDAGVLLDETDPTEAAEAAADELRHRWQLPDGPVGHVVRTLEHHGAAVSAVSDFDAKLDAFSLRTRNRPVVVLCSEKGVATRRRFDAAHELAHLVLHDAPSEILKPQEDQAHRFASAFLMPADSIGPWLISSANQLEVLEDGARIWGVSMQALVRRAKDLGTLAPADYARAMKRMSALGWRTREPVDIGPPEQPQLLERSLTELGAGGIRTIAGNLGIPVSRLNRLVALPEDQLDRGGAPVVPIQPRSAS